MEDACTFWTAHATSINGQTLPFVTALEASQHSFSSGQVHVHGFFSFPSSFLSPSLKFHVSFFKN
jgi:hypothetical protein